MNTCWCCNTGLTEPYRICNTCRFDRKMHHNQVWENFLVIAPGELVKGYMQLMSQVIQFVEENTCQ